MANVSFVDEREGQIAFFNQFGIDPDKVLGDNNDGVYSGTLFEFKLNVVDLNKVVFQCVKYLSRLRVRGKDVPSQILVVSLNTSVAYLYKSEVFRADIEKVYVGAASQNNSSFDAGDYVKRIDYSDRDGIKQIHAVLDSTEYMPVNVDENCVVGWAERYYKANPDAGKDDFLGDDGELRNPVFFDGRILPYKGDSNVRFKYLLDKLNEPMRKRDRGAFYTPKRYCELGAKLVREAIERVPDGNDYVIIDRCAGTGNLEAVLTDEELAHCIVSTYEYFEYKVLLERLGDKVLMVIPPEEEQVKFDNGDISNADAMSEEYLRNPELRRYLDDSHYSVIVFENPPFAETASVEHQRAGAGKKSSEWKRSWLPQRMLAWVKEERERRNKDGDDGIDGRCTNDKASVFIWSAFEDYLRQDGDCYVVYSPVKYWKYQHVIDHEFNGGYLMNRKHFHAGAAAVSCISWGYRNSKNKELSLQVADIDSTGSLTQDDDKLVMMESMRVQKTYTLLSQFYEKRMPDDVEEGICCDYQGNERIGVHRVKARWHKNYVGYLVAQQATFEQPKLASNLMTIAVYNGNGFYLTKDGYLSKLPLFAAGQYPISEKWWENGTIYKSADGGTAYEVDGDLKRKSLLFCCLSRYNKCRSFTGSDKRKYRNELCLDGDTLASCDLAKMQLTDSERALLVLWNKVLAEAKKCPGYDSNITYGVYQIDMELNTKHSEQRGRRTVKVPDYPELNGALNTLRTRLMEWYKDELAPLLFKYELLK